MDPETVYLLYKVLLMAPAGYVCYQVASLCKTVNAYKQHSKEWAAFQSADILPNELALKECKNEVMQKQKQRLVVLEDDSSFSYRNHSFQPFKVQLNNICELSFDVVKPGIGLPIIRSKGVFRNNKVMCQFEDTQFHLETLTKKSVPETRLKTPWQIAVQSILPSAVGSASTITVLTLNPVSLTLYGMLHFDELNNIFKLDTKFVAQSTSTISSYYSNKSNFLTREIGIKGAFAVLSVGLLAWCIYKFVRATEVIETHRKNTPSLKISRLEYVTADARDRLNCKYCHNAMSDIVLQCCHLTLCQQCLPKCAGQCPLCGRLSTDHIKLFVT